MKLSELQIKQTAVITKILGRGAFRKRITEMGFVRGKEVTAVKSAPLSDPIQYSIMGYQISLRKSEAELIEVVAPEEFADEDSLGNGNIVLEDSEFQQIVQSRGKIINVALVGNPNAGKTTLFNCASGAHEHTGNYSGVTVDAKSGIFKLHDYTFNIVDLPGTYSLTAYSPDELFVRKYIVDQVPDVIVNVVDATNLERNFYLTTQLIDMDVRVVIALNMYDELNASGDKLNYETLGKLIGIPFVPTISSHGVGITELFQKVIDTYEDREASVRHIHINYGEDLEYAIKTTQEKIRIELNRKVTDRISSRFLAIKLLEKDKQSEEIVENCNNWNEIKKTVDANIKFIENEAEEDSETQIADARYGFVAGALKETFTESPARRRKTSETIDSILTNKAFGFPIFILFLWIMFESTFTLGQYPQVWIESFVGFINQGVKEMMPDGILKDLITNGIIDGVGGVIVFLPNILILFFFISFMEDTGYMARAAFIMDKIMHKIGLHGKSFIPLIMGFGCNVPAIMATRTLDNRNDRLLTMLINPLMSCSARLPVYVLIIGAFFPENAGTALFSIYSLGIILAVIIALIFKRTLFRSKEVPFVMELPPYRMPTLKAISRHMWHKAQSYLMKMGGIILVASILIWTLGYFPREVQYYKNYAQISDSIVVHYTNLQTAVANQDTTILNSLETEKNTKIQYLKMEKESERQEKSYIGQIGKFITPVIAPLGFDWKMGVSLLSGMAAKEIVVSTLGVLYQADNTDGSGRGSLVEKLQSATHTSGTLKGQKVINPLVAYSFMVFILIYFPCVATVAVVKQESGSWKWAAFLVVYTCVLAWVLSFLVYRIGLLFLS